MGEGWPQKRCSPVVNDPNAIEHDVTSDRGRVLTDYEDKTARERDECFWTHI